MNPTISDVAERAGCSTATVSAVLNEKSTVSAATRQRVLRVIEELHYRPREAARHRLRARDGHSIGFVIKEDDNPFYSEIIAGARRVAEAHGYLIIVASSEGSCETERRIIELLMSKDIAGLLITPAIDHDADLSHIFDIKRRHIPFVLIEQVRGVQASLVDVDNVSASEAAAQHLIELGHSHLVHFAGPRYSYHTDERIEGVRRAFSRSLLAFPDDHIVYAGAHLKDGYETGLAYFRAHRGEAMPTAVTCFNDLVAIGLMTALHELGIRVPEDVSVVGFDDLELLAYLPWGLTSVSLPKQAMGERAAHLLIRQLEADRPLPPEKVHFDHQLVVRRSTAAPRLVPVAC